MMVMDHEETELEDMWALVDELGALSLRLKNAAKAAQQALGLPDEGTPA